MSPTPRLAGLAALVALSALVVPAGLVAGLALMLAGAALADARRLRGSPRFERRLPRVLARGVPAPLELEVSLAGGGRARVRQSAPAAVQMAPQEGGAALRAEVVPRARGRHRLPPAGARLEGPLRLVARHVEGPGESEVVVYPDFPAARRLALAVRGGRFREEGRRARGELGLGTDFESLRDYLPDDDIRQVNWRATARLGRPMSNQYRVERDRDVICLVDSGRLMAAPLGDRTRLDAALDALAAVGLVADALGDRCGAVAFDAAIRRRLAPRRAGGEAAIRALFDLEAAPLESDYELAFRTVGGGKRALVLVLTDLIEEVAARPLARAVPVLARRHMVVVASATDPDLAAAVRTPAGDTRDAYAAAVALDVLDARRRVARALERSGAEVLEAPADRLGAACVGAYLRAKSRARV